MEKENGRERDMLSRRDFLKISAFYGGVLVLGSLDSDIPSGFAQEAYPAGKITWIVGLAAGGGTDIMVRGVAPFMEKHLKAISPNPDKIGVMVKNLPGGAGMRAMSEVYHGKPDGYTIACDGEMLHTNTILGQLGFDLFEITYLARLAASNKVLVTNYKSNLNTWDDIVRASKKAPLRIAISGFGASNHVASLLFIDTTKLAAKPVIFDGAAGSNAALLRGDVPLGIQSEDSVRQLIDAKELRPVLTFSQKSKYSGVLNVKGIGFPELNDVVSSQRYVIAPPGMPANIKRILEDVLKRTMADPEFLAWNEKAEMSFDPVIGPELDPLVKNIHSFYKSKERILREYLLEKK